MKRFLILWTALFSAAFFCSCGNPLLGIGGVDPGSGGSGRDPSETTDKDVPAKVTPIYIDTQAQFDLFWGLGLTTEYPKDGYYILRGNGVADRIFEAKNPISSSTPPFEGTLTGWFKDETYQTATTIKMKHGNSFFPKVDGAVVSWLKFETETQPSTPIVSHYGGYAGIIAAEAEDTTFEYVFVSGTVNITVQAQTPPTTPTDIYAGGFVGKADSSTVFENCNAGAYVSVTFETGASGADGYVGGFAGELRGSVKKSSVSVPSTTSYGGSNPIQVNFTVKGGGGTGKTIYAGGVAGLLWGGTVTETSVKATVTAIGMSEDVYAGGYAGSVENNGLIKKNEPDGSGMLVITADSGSVSNGISAGGLVGRAMDTSTLDGNTVSGQVTVTAKYNQASSAYAGGLAGMLMDNAKITGSSVTNATANIQSYAPASTVLTGTAYAGGLTGFSDTNCVIEGSSITAYSGGVIAGSAPGVYPSYSPTVTAYEAYAGGVAGYAKGKISESYASLTTYEFIPTAQAQAGIDARVNKADGIAAAGGIAGKNEGEISHSYAVVTVKARAANASTDDKGAMAGGISGMSTSVISKTFALALVDARPVDEPNASSKAKAGGIAGLLSGTNAKIEQSYAAGGVLAYVASSSAQAGGIVGLIASTPTPLPTVEKCVALQLYVASDGDVHRVVGKDNSATLTTNYAYSRMRSSSGGSIIIPALPSDVEGDNITDTDAKDLNYYKTTSALGWDSGTWGISSYYPLLAGLTAPTVPTWAQIP